MRKYFPEIDGLRAIAVLPVILFHAHISMFSGGFVGVDVFFVISGYLITKMISSEVKEGKFSIAQFYERRARRILPALFAMVAVCTVLSYVMFLPDEFRRFGRSLVSLGMFASNLLFRRESGYFDDPANLKPLLHTWSLSIEEQFYIFYPLFLLFVFKFRKSEVIWRFGSVGIAIISLILCEWLVRTDVGRAFYLLPYRAWELMLGAILALGVFPEIRRRRVAEVISFLGLAFITWSVLAYSSETRFPGLSALLPCVGAAFVIQSSIHQQTLVARFLSLPLMTFIGKISYSLYLWHWPLLVFAKYWLLRDLKAAEGLVVIAFSIGLSILSYYWMETPFRNKKIFASRNPMLWASGVAIVIVVAVGGVFDIKKGLPGRFPELEFVKIAETKNDCALLTKDIAAEWKGDSCFAVKKDKGPKVLLWGDSFAGHYVDGFIANKDRINASILPYTAHGCAPVFFQQTFRANCNEFLAYVDEVIAKHEIDTVILSALWPLAEKQADFSWEKVTATVEKLKAKGLRVFVFGQTPTFSIDVQDIYFRSKISLDIEVTQQKVDWLNEINSRLKSAAVSADFIPIEGVFCSEQSCKFRDQQDFFFYDSGHFSSYGSKQVVSHLLPFIQKL